MIGDKKVLFSGMQATGNLTLGNYLGAEELGDIERRI